MIKWLLERGAIVSIRPHGEKAAIFTAKMDIGGNEYTWMDIMDFDSKYFDDVWLIAKVAFKRIMKCLNVQKTL